MDERIVHLLTSRLPSISLLIFITAVSVECTKVDADFIESYIEYSVLTHVLLESQ